MSEFTTPPVPTAPSIESEAVSHVTQNDATLEAKINPDGLPDGVFYQFQVVKNTSEYLPELVCPEERVQPDGIGNCSGFLSPPPTPGALPVGFIKGGSASQSVSQSLAAAGMTLQPDTTYHYRVLAVGAMFGEEGLYWQGPSVEGPDQTFTTPSASSPVIESEAVSNITRTDATLEAKINTEDLETSYEFHLATPPCPSGCEHLQFTFPLPSGKLLGSSVTQSVSLDLNSAGVTLTPGQRYEYWVTATNAAGTATTLSEEKTFAATGADQTFTAVVPAQGGQPPSDSAPSGSGGSSSTPNVNAPGLQVGKTTTLKSLTNARKLAKALKLCAKKPKKQRASCKKQAHKKYGKTALKAKKL